MYGDCVGFPQFFLWYGMGMGIEIQSPRQPWFWQQRGTKFRPFDKVEIVANCYKLNMFNLFRLCRKDEILRYSMS